MQNSRLGIFRHLKQYFSFFAVFLEKTEKEWDIAQENPLHCFILTNKLIAEYSGFQDIYDFFYKSEYYKKNCT